jgi:hypothetical protein
MEASIVQTALCDKWDITNNTAAVAFLLDSLAPALGETISERLEDKDSFHVVWMELMNEIQIQRPACSSFPSRSAFGLT